MKKIPLILITIIGLSVSAQGNNSNYTNEKSKTISFGVKAGAPNILSLNGEFVLPILNNHIAPFYRLWLIWTRYRRHRNHPKIH